jgi:hypothetical protein
MLMHSGHQKAVPGPHPEIHFFMASLHKKIHARPNGFVSFKPTEFFLCAQALRLRGIM